MCKVHKTDESEESHPGTKMTKRCTPDLTRLWIDWCSSLGEAHLLVRWLIGTQRRQTALEAVLQRHVVVRGQSEAGAHEVDHRAPGYHDETWPRVPEQI